MEWLVLGLSEASKASHHAGSSSSSNICRPMLKQERQRVLIRSLLLPERLLQQLCSEGSRHIDAGAVGGEAGHTTGTYSAINGDRPTGNILIIAESISI